MMTQRCQVPSSFSWPILVAVVVAGYLFHLRLGGSEPALWMDTVMDQQAVDVCLDDDRCLVRGVATSVPGLRHGTTWLHFRALAQWLGLDLEAFHLVLHLAGALTFLMTALVATRVAGPWAGLVAVMVLASLNTLHDFQPSVVYNNRILPFLGTLSLALCLAAASTKRVWPMILAAAVGAVTTEIHIVFSLFVLCLIATTISLARPWRALGFALLVFLALTVALSPETWFLNAATLTRGFGPSPYAVGEAWSPPRGVEAFSIAGIVALSLALALRKEERFGLLILLAFLTPIVLVYQAAVMSKMTTQTDKYLGAWLGGIAASFSCGVFLVARSVRRSLSRFVGGLQRPLPLPRALVVTVQVCLATSLLIWPGADFKGYPAPGNLPGLSMTDAKRIAGFAVSHGWSLEHTISRLRALQATEVSQLLPLVWPSPEPARPNAFPQATMTVLRVFPAMVPKTMPDHWEVLDRTPDSVLIAAITDTCLDWDRFEVCRIYPGREPTCSWSRHVVSRGLKVEENQVILAGWPWPEPATYEVEVRWKVRCPGQEHRIFIPVLMRGCAGRVVAASGTASSIAPDGRSATIWATGTGGTLAIRWRIGGPECSGHDWPYAIPFFVEAPVEDSRLLEAFFKQGRTP